MLPVRQVCSASLLRQLKTSVFNWSLSQTVLGVKLTITVNQDNIKLMGPNKTLLIAQLGPDLVFEMGFYGSWSNKQLFKRPRYTNL